jgi:signal transduction histidine kinase
MKELVGNLAHSFNNSLAPLTGYVTLLAEEIKPGSSGAQYLSKFEGSVGKAESMIESLVQATHPERTYLPKRTDLSALLQRTTEAWMKSLPASAQVDVQSHVEPCTLCVDEAQWTQVIRHLLRNAQTALADEGTLRLGLHQTTLTAAQAAELGMTDLTVYELVVTDTGGGMSEEVLERACDPLFTTERQAPMAGLGLTLVHSVVQLHGGQLELTSSEGEGTTVRIWIPADR